MASGLQLPFGIQPVNPVSVDYYYGPYPDLATAKAAILSGIRYLGQTCGIVTAGVTTEYWFQAGLADANLVAKGSGGAGAFIPLAGSNLITGDLIGNVPVFKTGLNGQYTEYFNVGPETTVELANHNGGSLSVITTQAASFESFVQLESYDTVSGGRAYFLLSSRYFIQTNQDILFLKTGYTGYTRFYFLATTTPATLTFRNTSGTVALLSDLSGGGSTWLDPAIAQQNTPPVSPLTNDRYIVGTSPGGAWAAQANQIAEWNGASWVFTAAVNGNVVVLTSTSTQIQFNGTVWAGYVLPNPILINGNSEGATLVAGTSDNQDFIIKTNNVNRFTISKTGEYKFHGSGLLYTQLAFVEPSSNQVVSFRNVSGTVALLSDLLLQTILVNQSGAYTLADFSSSEKNKDGFSRGWVIHPDGSPLNVPSSWLNIGDNVFSSVQNNEVMAYVLNKKVRYAIVYATLELVAPDTTAPTYVSSSINTAGTIISVVFSEDMAGTSNISVVGKTVTLVSFSGPSLILTLNTPFVYGDTITINGGNSLTDLSGNPFVGFSGQNVVNTVPLPDSTAPSLISMVVDPTGTKITDTYSESLDPASIPAVGSWAINLGVSVSSVSISGATVVKTLSKPILSGQSVTQTYTQPGSNRLQDGSLNAAISYASGAAGAPIVTNSSTVAIVMADDFTGIDTASIVGRTPTVGSAWARHPNTSFFNGLIGIASNDAKMSSGSIAYFSSDLAKSNVDCSITLGVIGTGGAFDFAVVDDNNNYSLNLMTGAVSQKVAGSTTTVVTASGTSLANDVMRVVKNGLGISVFRNGVLIGSGSGTNALTSAVKISLTLGDTTQKIKDVQIISA